MESWSAAACMPNHQCQVRSELHWGLPNLQHRRVPCQQRTLPVAAQGHRHCSSAFCCRKLMQGQLPDNRHILIAMHPACSSLRAQRLQHSAHSTDLGCTA